MFNYLKHNLALIIFVLVIGLAAFIRFFAAPSASGPDVAQFWAFAEVFRQRGIDFYRFADANQAIFPYQGWAYAYPPVWLLILGLVFLFVPGSYAGPTYIDSSWRLAVKTPIILADLAVGILLFWGLPGSKWRRLLFSSLWLLNPTAWYNSAVFGQFDSIATALLVASLLLFSRGRTLAAFIFGILAGMTKQTALIPLAMMTVAFAAQYRWTKLYKHIAIMAGIVLLISVPFLVTGNIGIYARTLIFSGQSPDYVDPVMYAFNGFGSLVTYLHEITGRDISLYFWFIIPVMVCAILSALFFVYRRKIQILRAALIGILVFISFFYRINYQYLVLMIALALIVAATSPYRSEKVITLALALLPAVWLWLFDVYFWFTCYDPKYFGPGNFLTRIGLAHLGYPDYLYVILAMALNILCLVYIILAFIRWRNPLTNLLSK
jgi:hypothetical protein